MLNLLRVSPRRPSEMIRMTSNYSLENYHDAESLNTYTKSFNENLRGVSSDTMMAIGPAKPPHPFTSSELISWKDHHSGLPRCITRSATTVSCKK